MTTCVLAIVAAYTAAAAAETVARRAERHLVTLPDLAQRLPRSIAERAMLADAADGRLDECDLLAAALIAERRSPDEQKRLLQPLDEHVAAARRRLAISPERPAAELLLEYLHEAILTGRFAADCHAAGRTLATGEFNCLSATLLYVGLAERCSVPAAAVLAPSHVYVRTAIAGRSENVETTCPAWFRRSAAEREAWLRAALGDASHEQQHRELSPVELLAVVYYNRGVDEFARRDFAAAAAENLVALRLDPHNSSAADNLLAAVNNWALAAAREGRRDLALELLRRGRLIAPDRADLRSSQRHVAGER